MTAYHTSPKADDDLIECARWIRADNPVAARHFLDSAFNTFDRLARFPQAGPLARLKNKRLAGMRFMVMPPPFNRWMIFYCVGEQNIEILRILYGTQNWRGKPTSFF